MSDDKETTNLSDLDEQLLNEAIVSTNGRDDTEEEIEHLALEKELTPFQALELEIHDELFESGLGWDKRAECFSPLKLCHYLMVTGGFKVGTETVFGRRCSKGFA